MSHTKIMSLTKCKFNDGKHKECFARKNGFCEALANCDFKDGECHFYKPKKEEKEKK